MKRRLSREEILEGGYTIPDHFISLTQTEHVKDRIKERGGGIVFIPTKVKVTRENIYSAETADNITLDSVVVRLRYTKTKNLFMCIDPVSNALKTIWFKDRWKQDKQRK